MLRWINNNKVLLLTIFNIVILIGLLGYIFFTYVFPSSSIKDIVSPILVLTNLVLITFIGIKTIKSDDKRFINQKKLEAYDELAKKILNYEKAGNKIFRISKIYQPKIDKKFNEIQFEYEKLDNTNSETRISELNNSINDLEKQYYELREFRNNKITQIADYFEELYFTVKSFKSRYSHVFSYNFENKNYNKIVELTKNIYEHYINMITKQNNELQSNKDNLKFLNEDLSGLDELLDKFLNNLLKEITTDNIN